MDGHARCRIGRARPTGRAEAGGPIVRHHREDATARLSNAVGRDAVGAPSASHAQMSEWSLSRLKNACLGDRAASSSMETYPLYGGSRSSSDLSARAWAIRSNHGLYRL